MHWRSSRSRIKSYESGINDVLKVWRLNSQRWTLEVPKIGQNYFEGGLEMFSLWNARKSRIGIKRIYYSEKEGLKIRWSSSRSRIKSYESEINEVLKVWRLNSLRWTLEVPKIGQNYFEGGFEMFSLWNAWKSRIGIKKI